MSFERVDTRAARDRNARRSWWRVTCGVVRRRRRRRRCRRRRRARGGNAVEARGRGRGATGSAGRVGSHQGRLQRDGEGELAGDLLRDEDEGERVRQALPRLGEVGPEEARGPGRDGVRGASGIDGTRARARRRALTRAGRRRTGAGRRLGPSPWSPSKARMRRRERGHGRMSQRSGSLEILNEHTSAFDAMRGETRCNASVSIRWVPNLGGT